MLRAKVKSSIASTFGRSYSSIAIISSIALAIVVLFYPLFLGSYFQPDVYRFEDRTTFHQYFGDRSIFSSLVDTIIINSSLLVWTYFTFTNRLRWFILAPLVGLFITGLLTNVNEILSILSLPLCCLALFLNKAQRLKFLQPDSSALALRYFMLLFLVLGLASIFLSLSDSVQPDPFIDIMILLSSYSPIIMVLVIFSFFVRLVLRTVLSVIHSPLRARILSVVRPFNITEYRLNRKLTAVALSSFMALSIVMVAMPHFFGQQHRASEDTVVYAGWINPMKDSNDIVEVFSLAFVEIHAASAGDRPVSLLILYVLSNVFETIVAFEIVLPAILAPLLVLTIYFLAKELTSNSIAALFSAFVTAISFQIMIGMYAGFLANWIAILFGYLSLLFANRFLNVGGKANLVWFSLSMVVLLFSHVYTWTIITAFLIVFLLVLRWRNLYESGPIKKVLLVVACVIVLDLVKSSIIGLSSGLQNDLAIAQTLDFGISQFDQRWSVLVRTILVHLGGIYGNILILLLVLYCTLLYRCRNVAGLFIMVFLSIAIVPFFFGDKTVQSRILYDIPFQIPAGMALANIYSSRNGKLVGTVIAVSMLALSIYTMDNLGVAPR